MMFKEKVIHSAFHHCDGRKVCCEEFPCLYHEWSPAITVDKVFTKLNELMKIGDMKNCYGEDCDQVLARAACEEYSSRK